MHPMALSAAIFLLSAVQVSAFVLKPLVPEQSSCATDVDCPFDGQKSKCCPADGKFSFGCPKASSRSGPTQNCTLPGVAGAAQCTCSVPDSCIASHWPYDTADPKLKQWLMIGDSITWNVHTWVHQHAEEHGLQMVHIPDNGKHVRWGLHCFDTWLTDPSRWDVISFNFGLHDLSLTIERIEPDVYGTLISEFANKLHKVAPRAALVWATTTAIPMGSDSPCDRGKGGCPPRRPADVPLYNRAASDALKSTSLSIKTVDLYNEVASRCGGESYATCRTLNFQEDLGVHFHTEGSRVLADRYIEAAARAVDS